MLIIYPYVFPNFEQGWEMRSSYSCLPSPTVLLMGWHLFWMFCLFCFPRMTGSSYKYCVFLAYSLGFGPNSQSTLNGNSVLGGKHGGLQGSCHSPTDAEEVVISLSLPTFKILLHLIKGMAQMVKNLTAVLETWVWSLGQEDPLEKGMAILSSILA